MDISKLANPGRRVPTEGLGVVVVRSISIGAVQRICAVVGDVDKVSDQALAAAIIVDVCKLAGDGPDAKDQPITAEQAKKLTTPDKTLLHDALFAIEKRESVGSVGDDPDQAIARDFRKALREIGETGKKLADQVKRQLGTASESFRRQMDSLSGVNSVLSRDTMKMLEQVSAQSALLKNALQLPDWLARAEEQQRQMDAALGPIRASLRDVDRMALDRADLSPPIHYDAPRIPELDLSNSPIARTANAVEQHTSKLEDLAQAQRLALEINNQMHGVVARVAGELSVQAKSNDRQTRRNFWVAIAAIVVSFAASIGQIVQAYWFNLDNNMQQTKSEEIAREQRDSLKAILRQNQQDNAALREQLNRQNVPVPAPAPAATTPSRAQGAGGGGSK